MSDAKLTPKQKTFVLEYLKDLNATQAAIRSGYSVKTAYKIGAENLIKPQIQAAIAKAQNERESKTKIDANWLLTKLSMIASFNINRFIVVKDGKAYYDFSTATDDDWYCITEYSANMITKGAGDQMYEVDSFKLKTADKMKALELIGKHIDVGAFKERVEHSGNVGITIANDEQDL